MLIETDRSFKVKPKDGLYYREKGCKHPDWYPKYQACRGCRKFLTQREFIGTKSVFESDGLTFSKLDGIYFKGLYVKADLFDVLEEVKDTP